MSIIEVGTDLIIKPEFNNPVDSDAWGFYLENDYLLGYVSMKEKPFLKCILNQGYPIYAKISKIQRDYIDARILLSSNMIDASAIEQYNINIALVSDKKCINSSYNYKLKALSIQELKDYIENK